MIFKPRSAVVIVLVGMILSAGGCTRQQRIERHLNRGDEAYAAGDFDRAEKEYIGAIVLESDSPDALGRLGSLCYDRGQLAQAYAFLEQALKDRPENGDFRLKFALACLAVGRSNDARTHARKVLESRPRDEIALLLLAETCVTTRDNQEARRIIEELQSRNDAAPGYHIALGALQRAQKQYAAAEAELQKALVLDPNSSLAYDQQSMVFTARGDTQQAAYALRQAALLAPPRAVVRIKYVNHLVRNGARDEAKKELAAIIAKAPDSIPALLLQLRLALEDRRLDEGAALARKVLERDGSNHDALVHLAAIRLAQGDADAGIAELKRAESHYPQMPEIKYQLALAHLSRSDPYAAEEHLKNAISLSPNYEDALVLMAQINLQKGNPAEAIARLKTVLQRRPQSRRAQVMLAQAYRVSGDEAQGLAILQSLAEAAPHVPDNHHVLGLALLRRDRAAARRAFEKTVAIAETHWAAQEMLLSDDLDTGARNAAVGRTAALVEKHPQEPAAWLLRANVRLATADMQGAESDLRRALELNPNLHQAYLQLAKIYFETERGQDAVTSLAVSAAKANRPGLYTQLGMLHAALGQHELARGAYEKALALEADFIPALNNLAALHAEQLKQPEKALSLARQAHNRAPGDPMVADTLGWVLFLNGQYAGALPLLESSAEKLPADPAVLHHLAMTYYYLGQEAAARQTFARVVAAAGNSPLGIDAAGRLAVLDINPDAPGASARDSLARHAERNPTDIAALTRLGLIEARDGDAKQAKEWLEAALKINPRSVPVMVALVDLYLGRVPNLERARELADKAHALVPNDGNVSWRLGTIVLRTGHFAWAASLLQDGVRSLPDQADLRFELARALYGAGRVPAAEQELKTVLDSQVSPLTRAAADRMSSMLLAMRQPANLAGASAEACRILAADADDIPALMVLAADREQQGDSAEAARLYQQILSHNTSFTPAIRRLAWLYAEHLGDDFKAEELAIKARQDLPDDPDLALVLGSVSYRRADYAASSRFLRQALRSRPDHGPTVFLLGVSLFYLKNAPESRTHLERALQLSLPPQETSEAERLLRELGHG